MEQLRRINEAHYYWETIIKDKDKGVPHLPVFIPNNVYVQVFVNGILQREGNTYLVIGNRIVIKTGFPDLIPSDWVYLYATVIE